MKASIIMIMILSVVLVVLTVVKVDAVLPPEGGCWITGGGTLGCSQPDSFSGIAWTNKKAEMVGQWSHISSEEGVIFQGDVHYLVCKSFLTLSGPGVPTAYPNYVNFGGTGSLNGVDGYFFDVKVFDHGEPGIYLDRYEIDIYDASHVLVFHADGTRTKDECNQVCLDDVKVTSDLAWVSDMGCISGGNIQIMPPNGGHPF